MQSLDNYGDQHYDGRALKHWLVSNLDVGIYIAAAYLCVVFQGPSVIAAVNARIGSTPSADAPRNGSRGIPMIKKVWVVWNAALSIFSFYGSSRVVPVLVRNLLTHGLHDTLCTFREEEFYTTHVGFAIGLFAVSKLPEFGDTFFLLLQGKRNLPFLQWFHHVTTFLFAWYAYSEGTSIFICAAAMNYFVHTIMYFYFAMAEAGYKNLVKPFAMYITLLQIAQMVGGLFFTGFVMREKLMNGADNCSGTSLSNARVQMLIYVANFYMFCEMFVKAYILPRKPSRGAAAPNKAQANA